MNVAIRDIQLKCLEILDIVDGICRSNDIKYSLCGGSVVGAHLYKGCLPWDDDIDVMMTREHYDRFCQIAPSLLPQGFVLQNFHNHDPFTNGISKVINENTTYVEENGRVEGIFLDITVYDRIPENAFLRWVDVFLCKRSLTVMKGPLPGSGVKNRVRTLLLKTFWTDKRKFFLRFERIARFLGRHVSRYTYSELFGAWAQTISYRASVFDHYATIEFEGKQYMVVRDYIEYLQTRYRRTDFHEPKEKQVAPHLYYVNLEVPYKKYLEEHGKLV